MNKLELRLPETNGSVTDWDKGVQIAYASNEAFDRFRQIEETIGSLVYAYVVQVEPVTDKYSARQPMPGEKSHLWQKSEIQNRAVLSAELQMAKRTFEVLRATAAHYLNGDEIPQIR